MPPRKSSIPFTTCLVLTLQLLVSTGFSQSRGRIERVLIETPKPYSIVVARIQALGGTVTNQFTYVDAISAEIPSEAMGSLRDLVGADSIQRDLEVPKPGEVSLMHRPPGTGLGRPRIAVQRPPPAPNTKSGSYVLNFAGTGLDDLHSQGLTGAGVIVAVVDSGIRPGFASLDKSIIGGVDFVGDRLGYSSPLNDPHGTFVASMIAAEATLNARPGPVRSALELYAPGALTNGTSIKLTGSAPKAKIFVVRVFSPNPAVSTTESQVIAAIDHITGLKRKFDNRQPGGLNIQVANLSLGNTTLC